MDNTNKPGSPFDFNPLQGGTTPPPVFPPEPPPAFPPAPPPTFTPEPPPPPPPAAPSPLDNPWGAPPQPPPISSVPVPEPVPTWTPPEPTPPPLASPLGGPPMPEPTPPPANPLETAPTDLSHLVGNSTPEPIPQPMSAQAETLVVPPVTPEVPAAETGKRGAPKWLIGLGVGLLLAVVGTSAYFIMGIGQAPKGGSIPAVPTETTQQVKPPAPLPTPVVETETSSFGQLQGGGQQATSAGDLLRQGQQQGR